MRIGKRFTTRFLPTLLVFMSMLLAACGGSSTSNNTSANTTPAPTNKQVFVNALAGEAIPDFGTLDPALVQTLNDSQAIQLIFTGLVTLDDNLKIQCQLCSSYDKGSDGVTWTFHLKPNLKFSDGTSLTSSDVAYSIDRSLQPATNSAVGPYYLRFIKDADKLSAGKIKTIIGDSIMTPDASTISIVAAKSYPFFLDTLTYPTSYVVEKSLITKYSTHWTDHLTEGGGAGPFKVQEYTHSKQLVVVANPNYYGTQPKLQKMIIPFYKEADTSYQAYKVGQVEFTTVPTANIAQAKTGSDFHTVNELAIFYYTMSYFQKPFDNMKIRQAFDLALNKELVATAAYKNTVLPSNHIVPAGMPGYDNSHLTGPDGVASTKGNQAMAKQLLTQGMQEEGYTSVSQLPPITLTWASGGVQAAKNEVSIEISQWQSVLGVSVKTDDLVDYNRLVTEETSSVNNPKGLQFYAGPGWITDYPDPQDWLTLQFDKGAGQNNMNYGQNNTSVATQQQAVQHEMEQADLTQDPAAREKMYLDAEQKLINDVAWLPTFQAVLQYLVKPCVVGFRMNEEELTDPEDWGSIYIANSGACGTTS